MRAVARAGAAALLSALLAACSNVPPPPEAAPQQLERLTPDERACVKRCQEVEGRVSEECFRVCSTTEHPR